jgi:hypothetical protein
MAIDFPSSPTTGQEFIASNGRMYWYDSTGWTTRSSDINPDPQFANPFKYRTIYSRGYVAGGYQNTSPWRNVNRTVHYTDTTTNLGDIMDTAAAYTDGSYSDYYQYIYAANASWPGTGTYTAAINMTNETSRTHLSAFDLKSSAGGYGDVGVIINSNLTMAWILSDQTAIDKHNLVNETMYYAGAGGSCGTAGDFICTWYGQYYGWVKHNYAGNRNHKIDYSTDTWSSAGLTVGTDGWGKALPTKEGWAYVKNGGNIVSGTYKVNDTTGANIRTDLNFPETCGEENFQTGQQWGYSLGNYNGAQNNNTHKITHSTDSIVTMGSSTQPQGHGGMSSAACASASSMILGGA